MRINKKFKLLLVIVLNISILFIFKYFEFFISFFTDEKTKSVFLFSLPIGISFYIFQILAYHFDVYKKKITYANDYTIILVFISFFPQLIAGPIMRAKYLIPQLQNIIYKNNKRKIIYSYGLLIILVGLIKKIIFADNLSILVDDIFIDLPADFIIAWCGAFLFSFQIYFDFSGYSDIAIGSAYILGIRLIKNFDTPYFSISPREFWTRWHISLSTWIRDYIYIPLGGSRKNILFSFFILLFTMILAGLWHGANVTFLLWGFLWGIYIYAFRFIYIPKSKLKVFFWFINFFIIMILWVIFRSENIYFAIEYIKIMFSITHLSDLYHLYFNFDKDFILYFFIFIILFFTHFLEKYLDNIKFLIKLKNYNNIFIITCLVSLITIITFFPSDNPNPFIYFRF